MAFIIASSLLLIQCAVPKTTPGKPPQEPAVGAATITPIELFTSIIADTYIIVVLSTSPPINSFASYIFLNCGD
jgi:ABC-type Zn uptake system ZnuABC Zn-binding protein ZnuA